jgi:hypothetical protein
MANDREMTDWELNVLGYLEQIANNTARTTEKLVDIEVKVQSIEYRVGTIEGSMS